uniref:Uncharacterized protein n=1 Tax=Oryza brachyantha TaxID=4533 RepID=J3LXS8_ORYBR
MHKSSFVYKHAIYPFFLRKKKIKQSSLSGELEYDSAAATGTKSWATKCDEHTSHLSSLIDRFLHF